MSIKEERIRLTEAVASCARDTDDIAALISAGDDKLAPGDLRIIAVVKEGASVNDTYKMLNYYITSDVAPSSGKGISRSDTAVVKQYSFDSGMELTLRVCDKGDLGEIKWHRDIFDNGDIALSLAGAVAADELIADDQIEQPAEPEPDDGFDSLEAEPDGISVVAVPGEEKEPEEQPKADDKPEEKSEEDKYWDYVSEKMLVARHAIRCGSLIRAGEVISLLRHMLIELICVRHGITENFDHSIDFIECEEKDMLAKTYPASFDSASIAAALGVVSELFDRLG